PRRHPLLPGADGGDRRRPGLAPAGGHHGPGAPGRRSRPGTATPSLSSASAPPGGPGRTPPAEPPRRTIAMPGVAGRGTLEGAVPAPWLGCPVVADDAFAHWMARDWRAPDVSLWLRLELHDLEEDDAGPVGSSGPRLLDWLRGR